jgi:hypothetical protein
LVAALTVLRRDQPNSTGRFADLLGFALQFKALWSKLQQIENHVDDVGHLSL